MDEWNKAINDGIKGLKRVHKEMQRRGEKASDKEELGRIYIYGFLAASIYTKDPFKFCENAQAESSNPKKPNLKAKLAMQQRSNAILKSYKLLPKLLPGDKDHLEKTIIIPAEKGGMFKKKKEEQEVVGTFRGIFGGRKINIGKINIERKQCLEEQWKKTVGENLPESFKAVIPETFDIPRYTIGYAEDKKEICILVRGTSSMGDALTDMVCNTVPSVCGHGIAHAQMQWAALVIAMDIYPHLREYIDNKKCDKITCVGHSLGAGTASLLAIILNTEKKKNGCGFKGKVTAYGYGTPPILNNNAEPLKEGEISFLESTKSYIIAVVNQHDLVSRIATQNMSSYVWIANNASIIEEWTGKKKQKKEKENGDKKKGSLFGSMGDKAKAMADQAAEKGRKMAISTIQFMQNKIDGILAQGAAGKKGDQEFNVLWIPGRIQHMSYKYLGQVQDAKNFAKKKASFSRKPTKTTKVLETKTYLNTKHLGKRAEIIEVETREYLMMHEVPRNHPRICWMIVDVRMGLDHLMGNYLRNLAEIYEKCPGNDYPVTTESGDGCMEKLQSMCTIL